VVAQDDVEHLARPLFPQEAWLQGQDTPYIPAGSGSSGPIHAPAGLPPAGSSV